MNIADKIDRLIAKEGGYTNHPNDRGGPTIWGITEQVARAFGYRGDMREMARSVAVDIYTKRYWTQPRLDEIAVLSDAIAEELLDTGVNMGSATAGKFLQRALNVLNRGGTAYPDLTVDGGIGKVTAEALRVFLESRGAAGETVLLRMLNAQQSVRYMEIAESNPTQEVFVFGWQQARVS